MNILLVEDNNAIVEGLKFSFKKNGLNLESTNNIKESKIYINKNKHDLIILDVSLPDGNGFDFYNDYIKQRNIPTIFLTAKDNENDIVKGLNLGAEDYITKPFSTKELLARVNKALARNKENTIINVKDIFMDIDKMVVYKDNEKIELTGLELKILSMLFLNLNKIVKRNDIIDLIWETTRNDVDEHTVTVYMKRIREKIGDGIITTVKGIGYGIFKNDM